MIVIIIIIIRSIHHNYRHCHQSASGKIKRTVQEYPPSECDTARHLKWNWWATMAPITNFEKELCWTSHQQLLRAVNLKRTKNAIELMEDTCGWFQHLPLASWIRVDFIEWIDWTWMNLDWIGSRWRRRWHSQMRRSKRNLPFDQRAAVRIGFAVESRQDHGHDDTRQEEKETPTNRSPESVLQTITNPI